MKVHKKNPSWMAGGMTTMLLCTLLFSCNNEDFLESGNLEKACDNICFGISSDKNVQTRGYAGSDDEGYTAGRFVLRSDDSADTLCVRAIVSDGINVSGFEGEQALTRGVPVDNKDNFYGSFKVLAYWQKNGTHVERFYMDEEATKNGDVWKTGQTYYWPGADHSFQFYAWAPTDAGGLVTPTTPETKTLEYTVPEAAAAQKDIMVAVPETSDTWISGDNNAAVPLSFKHICTAVRFSVGNQMQPGVVKSVALKGVKGVGTYNMASNGWTLDETSTRDFSQEVNMGMNGDETDGTAITSSAGTFMMLPQTLPEGAMVEVDFTNASGDNRTLTASIAGSEWKMGTTVNYKLSITPEYELEFVSQPKVQDAHYVIYPITIRSDDKLPAGGWTLTSNDPTNITFVEKGKFESDDVQALVDAGYWLDGYNGESELTSSTTGEVQVYVFLKENVTEKDRNITLSLKPAAEGNYEAKKFSFTQYCPAWNNGLGMERIQDKDYPWGFNWDSDMKIVYTMPKGFLVPLWRLLFEIFGDHSYIISSGGVGWFESWIVTVDFTKVPTLTTATDPNDGNKNTWELYNFNGISEAETIMKQLESWGGIPDKTLPTNPAEFAARACAMKNKYRVETKTKQGKTVYCPVLDQTNMVWYLPAQNEAVDMNDNLSGDYWTSTAITDPGTTAYKYTVGGSTSEEDRNNLIHVRAVRMKP